MSISKEMALQTMKNAVQVHSGLNVEFDEPRESTEVGEMQARREQEKRRGRRIQRSQKRVAQTTK